MFRLVIDNLYKRIEKKTILDNISLVFEAYKIYAIIGNNGVGKTTFFRSITGLTSYSGIITIYDEKGEPHSELDYLLANTGVVMQFPERCDSFSIREIFKEHLLYMGVTENVDLYSLLSSTGLQAGLDERISSLSLGMKKKLNLAIALSHSPKILLLDEPYSALDTNGVHGINSILVDFKRRGGIVIMSDHSLRQCKEVVDEVINFDDGAVITNSLSNYCNLELETIPKI